MVHTYAYTLLCIEFNIISATLSQCPDLLEQRGTVYFKKIEKWQLTRGGASHEVHFNEGTLYYLPAAPLKVGSWPQVLVVPFF